MPPESHDDSRLRSGWRSWHFSTTVALALAAILTWFVGWFGLAAIDRMSTTGLEARLSSEVETCVLALEMWLDDQRKVGQSWASDAGVRTEIVDFMNSPLWSDWDKDRVLASDELKRLRMRLAPVCAVHGYVGFVVIDRNGRQVATLLDEALGISLDAKRFETIHRALLGEAVVTLPFLSSIAFPDENGLPQQKQSSMLVAAPVRDREGTVVAALAFRLRTTDQFVRALESARPGETGETYAFDKNGLLLSDSRFNTQLRRLGLISTDPNSRAVFELELRDPGGNLTGGFRSTVPREALPLTRMAMSATQGENRVDVAGYRDYRGMPVVGAWRWLPTYEFGVTREIDFDEAYAPLVAIRRVFMGWLGLFASALIASIAMYYRRQQSEQLRERAELALRHERFLFQTLMENLPDSIYFKDSKSHFLRISKALADRFGLSDPKTAVGKTDFDYFTTEHAERAQADEQELMNALEPVIDKEERETWTDGRRTWVATSKFPLRNETGLIVGTFGISRDITERKLADERFRLVVEASLNALLMVDQGGKIILLNSQAEKLFDYTRDELIGQSLEILVPPNIRASHPHLRSNYFKKPEVRAMGLGRELQGLRRDGSCVSIEIGLSPLETEDGVFALASVVDITARKAIEESLRAAKDAAEATSRSKSDFLANMSHEIRTPMNAIIGMTELVLGTDLPAMQREYLTMVLESGESLLAIINEILDFSKIEAGKMKLELVDFALWDVVGDAVKSLALRAHSKNLELAYHIGNDIPEMFVSDPVRLRQIIVNLVGNAIKFTEQGEVLITVSCIDQNKSGMLLRFAVTDTGMGIAAEKQKLIFDAFTQADSSTTRRFGGTGLGLAISSRLVSLFGAELELQSELGKGSTFSFTAWLARSTQVHVSSVHLRPDLMQGTRVLIVDDNATNRRIVQEMVRGWGMIPLVATSAAEALQLLDRVGDSVPILLTDMHMPEMDGMMLVEQIRRNPNLVDLRIIVLSSGNPSSSADRWEALGVAARLMKPFKQSELLTAIESALTLGNRVTGRVEEAPKEVLPKIPSLRILLAEDGLTNQKFAVALLQKWGHVVTVANDGREAVNACENQSFDLVLMDVQMPEMDGLEATVCIRALESKLGRHTPIVAMTARAMKGDRDLCLESGMDGYVTKPVRQRELYQAIAAFFIT